MSTGLPDRPSDLFFLYLHLTGIGSQATDQYLSFIDVMPFITAYIYDLRSAGKAVYAPR
jgi:hypothetical protein